MLLCDVKSRWTQLSGKPSYFTIGTDEHGLKVQNASEKNKLSPKEFCTLTSQKFKDLANMADIKYDRFIRTTDPDHAEAVVHFWNVLLEKGYIYKGQHTGWYSISDETFYPEQQIESKFVDGLLKYFSTETGSEVVFETEENYFFKLKHFRQDLIKLLKEKDDFIIPRKYQLDILKELESSEGQDLSISRPSSRLHWGIPVPNDPSQVIYVWVDALVNYITSAGYPWMNSTSNPWPATHLIGKDITRFHCIYWPSLLMAAGVELPEQIVVHGHWLMGGSKMSKSKGNVADPVVISDYYGSDMLRFFLTENSILTSDCDFTEQKLNLSRNQFIDKLCNLMTRAFGKKFNVERALSKVDTIVDEKFIDTMGPENHVADIKKLLLDLDSLYTRMDQDLETFTTHRAVDKVWDVLFQANQVFQDGAPWQYKSDPALEGTLSDPLNRQDLLVFTALETVRVTLIVLQPFIPELAEKLLDILKVDPLKRGKDYAKIGQDLMYGKSVSRGKGEKVPLEKLPLREGAYA